MPEGLRVDVGARLAGDDLFAVADGGATTSEASIDLRPDGEDGGAQVAALLPCTAAFMAVCFQPPHSRRVTTKALGHAWRAIVGELPALAPISLPLDKSKR